MTLTIVLISNARHTAVLFTGLPYFAYSGTKGSVKSDRVLMPVLLSELRGTALEAAFAIDRKGSVGLQDDDLPVANLRCGFGSLFGYLLMRVPQLRVKARLAHSACFAAIALREVMTAGRTMENRAGHCVGIGDGYYFCPAANTLLTDDLVASDTESGHSPPHRARRITE